ncbi:hypothetical protein HU200_015919 [Digitaria exilis]|uniref:F-box domain-containing protein n=1 Tax=Digitaria exilis TaxID=1010633 RepID=A0A835KLF1_9POAL|nr:hypothetical protein HU200_015919 [Digitaria exilis]
MGRHGHGPRKHGTSTARPDSSVVPGPLCWPVPFPSSFTPPPPLLLHAFRAVVHLPPSSHPPPPPRRHGGGSAAVVGRRRPLSILRPRAAKSSSLAVAAVQEKQPERTVLVVASRQAFLRGLTSGDRNAQSSMWMASSAASCSGSSAHPACIGPLRHCRAAGTARHAGDLVGSCSCRCFGTAALRGTARLPAVPRSAVPCRVSTTTTAPRLRSHKPALTMISSGASTTISNSPRSMEEAPPSPRRHRSRRCVLPEDALYEILLRLPAKDLCRLRAVCRPWRSLLSDPHFIDAHAARHPDPLVVVGCEDCEQNGPVLCDVVDLSGRIVKRVRAAGHDDGSRTNYRWVRFVMCTHADLVCLKCRSRRT